MLQVIPYHAQLSGFSFPPIRSRLGRVGLAPHTLGKVNDEAETVLKKQGKGQGLRQQCKKLATSVFFNFTLMC